MTDENSQKTQEPIEPEILPGGPTGQIEVWTPPAMPWGGCTWGSGQILRTLQSDGVVVLAWNQINLIFQGDKPPRWINLLDAVWIIAQKLDVPMGVAEGLLQKEALPPDVPWVGLRYLIDKRPMTTPTPWVINRAMLDEAPVNLYPVTMMEAPEYLFMFICTELNHLETWMEAWLKKNRPAPMVQPVPSTPAKEDRAPKNRGRGYGPYFDIILNMFRGLDAQRWKQWCVRSERGMAAYLREHWKKLNPAGDAPLPKTPAEGESSALRNAVKDAMAIVSAERQAPGK